MSEGQKSRARSGLGGAALVMLAGLAPAGAACGLAGDETVLVGSCAHFVTTVRTSEPSYAPGQTVIISVIQANDGPVCTIPPQPCGPPQAFASAYNPAGKDVWDAGAHKTFPSTHITCPEPGRVPSWTWAANYSDTQEFDWSQDDCTDGIGLPGHANPGCPDTQVPADTYRIVGEFYWSDGRTAAHGPSASATITISGKTPLHGARHRPPGDART